MSDNISVLEWEREADFDVDDIRVRADLFQDFDLLDVILELLSLVDVDLDVSKLFDSVVSFDGPFGLYLCI